VSLAEVEDGRPLCLSLANTRHWRNSAAPRETLQAYGDLAKWAVARQLVPDDNSLAADALARPDAAHDELRKTIALREAIARIFSAQAHRRTPRDADFEAINASFNEASRCLWLVLVDGTLVPELARPVDPLAIPRLQAAVSAIGLLGSTARSRVKQCADGRGCGWLFLDATRNGSRQFCFSSECGNRARQARFREKHRAGGHTGHAD
jgi:predicted RNA-binding Zn ribbon-like protein